MFFFFINLIIVGMTNITEAARKRTGTDNFRCTSFEIKIVLAGSPAKKVVGVFIAFSCAASFWEEQGTIRALSSLVITDFYYLCFFSCRADSSSTLGGSHIKPSRRACDVFASALISPLQNYLTGIIVLLEESSTTLADDQDNRAGQQGLLLAARANRYVGWKSYQLAATIYLRVGTATTSAQNVRVHVARLTRTWARWKEDELVRPEEDPCNQGVQPRPPPWEATCSCGSVMPRGVLPPPRLGLWSHLVHITITIGMVIPWLLVVPRHCSRTITVRENHVWRRKGLTRGKCLLAGEGWAVELY
jgi:hypothetical protein